MDKKDLMQYIGLKLEVENQLERISRARNNERIPAMRESDGSQRQPGGNGRMENAIIRRLDLEERLRPEIEEKLDAMQRIENAIDCITDPMEREVLRLRYIDGSYCRLTPWRDVAIKIYGDDEETQVKAVWRLHGRALQSIRKIKVEEVQNALFQNKTE